jgi:hypothetical protein
MGRPEASAFAAPRAGNKLQGCAAVRAIGHLKRDRFVVASRGRRADDHKDPKRLETGPTMFNGFPASERAQ